MTVHIPVLLNETVDYLTEGHIRSGERDLVYVDGTLGGGGHTLAIWKAVGGANTGLNIIGIDQDSGALARTEKRLKDEGIDGAKLHNDSFRNIDKVLASENGKKADFILYDIGISSDQLDKSKRGFSFRENEPLLMTMRAEPELGGLTAKEVVNMWSEEDLSKIIYEYGEEKYARKIAKGIVKAREKGSIKSTHDLAQIIKDSTPFWYHTGKIHPATRTFQALRIAVNDELGALKEGIIKGWSSLRVGGRLAIISFHSLEDRIVKHYFKHFDDIGEGKILTKKPVVASSEETEKNPRSRSAKLRVIEKIK